MSGIETTAHGRWRAVTFAALLAASLAAGLTFGPTVARAQLPVEDPPAGADDLRARGLMTQAILAQGNLDRAIEYLESGLRLEERRELARKLWVVLDRKLRSEAREHVRDRDLSCQIHH